MASRCQPTSPLPVTGGLLGLLGPGSYSTSIRVTDSTGAIFDRAINFTVLPSGLFSATRIRCRKALVNTAYSFQFVGYGGSDSYIWGASGLPAGLTINSSTGLLTEHRLPPAHSASP